jgi:hypothetical protein
MYQRLLPGDFLLASTCHTSLVVAGQSIPRFRGCTKLLPHAAGFDILLPVRGKTCRTCTYHNPHGRGCSQELSYSKSFDPDLFCPLRWLCLQINCTMAGNNLQGVPKEIRILDHLAQRDSNPHRAQNVIFCYIYRQLKHFFTYLRTHVCRICRHNDLHFSLPPPEQAVYNLHGTRYYYY